eukprot:352831-Chlamydomonas_euryale.AAC.2
MEDVHLVDFERVEETLRARAPKLGLDLLSRCVHELGVEHRSATRRPQRALGRELALRVAQGVTKGVGASTPEPASQQPPCGTGSHARCCPGPAQKHSSSRLPIHDPLLSPPHPCPSQRPQQHTPSLQQPVPPLAAYPQHPQQPIPHRAPIRPKQELSFPTLQYTSRSHTHTP